MVTMPTNGRHTGDETQRSANDAFMDSWAVGDDQSEDENPHHSAPGLLPGMLIGAGVASLCAIGIYLAAGGSDTGTSQETVTYTQPGPTATVQSPAPASTSTVTLPQQTVTVKVIQPVDARTVTVTATTTASPSSTPTSTTTTTMTTTVTTSVIVGPTLRPGG